MKTLINDPASVLKNLSKNLIKQPMKRKSKINMLMGVVLIFSMARVLTSQHLDLVFFLFLNATMISVLGLLYNNSTFKKGKLWEGDSND